MFCEGRGPFRWTSLVGDAEDIRKFDQLVLDTLPDNVELRRWIEKAQQHVKFQGLPARVCWLGYGERAKFGARINEMVRTGKLSGPYGSDAITSTAEVSP